MLTPEQVIAVDDAERRANYATCIQGVYATLCNHNRLTREQAVAVRQAEHRENRRVCSTPAFQWSCRRDWLAEDDNEAAQEAAAAASRAPGPSFPSAPAASVPEAPAAAVGPVQPPASTAPPSAKARCEAFWLGAIAPDGGYVYLSDYTRLIPLTVADKAKLAQWQRGQRLERCGARLTNEDIGQSIAVSE
ncbi:hypothetical protein [Burkholderia sp. Bp9140]|uniref:hypothetical protein n=1 Tax=Burkholderia sp. Bp9140 TaxID=2184572 RepID=UPI000F58A9D0|nr:hypothetical protein [Burkholderia sp. Bp9140]